MDGEWSRERRRMAAFLGQFVLPLLLLAAALVDWSLISLTNLLLFFAILANGPRKGLSFRRLYLISWWTVLFSVLSIIAQVIFNIIWSMEGNGWSMADSWWAKLIGFARVEPWGSRSVVYFVIIQLAVAVVAFVEIHGNGNHGDSCWLNFSSAIHRIGSHLRVACCLLLPAFQLVVGISRPSWISLPFFVGSCVGLVDWSLTSNFLGLFRWWRSLQLYACFSSIVLYVYQLPVDIPQVCQEIADFIGLYKITTKSELPEISSGISLLLFYFMLSSVKCDLNEMDSIMSRGDSLTEQLLPATHSFFIREYRSGVRHTNFLLRGPVFRNFSINYFTYGFPVLLLALSFWSFSFASICAFCLLGYVGYILYAFPSLFRLHRLNGLLLVFILLWATSTYIFNVTFTYLNKEFRKDMEVWETAGFWHYPIPGFFLLAQFCLGVLVAIGNLVNNSVFQYLSDSDVRSSTDDHMAEENEDTKVLIIATIAWGLRQCARAITLFLIFLRVMKPGYIHAVYMCFFLVYLLARYVSKSVRQALVLFCMGHFALLYILQLNLISRSLEHSGSLTMVILSQLGIACHANSKDFLELGGLLCFCAVQNHGLKLLFSLSAIVQHTPHPPFGFSILKAGLNKSVLLSVYASSSSSSQSINSVHEKLIATYLSQVGQKCLSTYRSCGTYVAFLTILLALYLVRPNYISFGYLFFLLVWIIGRQLVEKTKRRLWLPLKVYAIIMFVFTYCLSISSTLQTWVSKMVNVYPDLGFNPEASLLENVSESLAVLIVMQLYSYERDQNRDYTTLDDSNTSELGVFGFIRRFLIWHSEKILSVSVFYASLSPISAFGFLYLLGLIVCSTLPKASRIPSKLFLVYTGFLVTSEYLFQMLGKQAHIFPGQQLYRLSEFLGFKYFGSGFWGLESGLRGKLLVIVACILQYNVFHWLRTMPRSLVNRGKWEEPCQLFVSEEYQSFNVSHGTEDKMPLADSSPLSSQDSSSSIQQGEIANSSHPFSFKYQMPDSGPSIRRDSEGNTAKKYSFGYIWGSSRESHKWNKKHILALKKERFEMQKTTLKIYVKFWIENLFKLRGLEINMIALLVASFNVLNLISMFYIMCLVTCIFLKRKVICKLWPIFVFSFASILVLEYFAIWKDLIPWVHSAPEMKIHCLECWSSSIFYFNYCTKCWLGIVVDDPRMLTSYYIVFILSSFKLRSDYFTGFSVTQTYLRMKSQRKNALVWRDLSFETKSFWTFLDYLRLYSYCHLLDIVLALILITGTLEYDILHLGYLGFALVFFRMRLEILKKKNKIFKYLRMYNFALIVLSLAYQSPYVGEFTSGKCDTLDYVYEVIGLYKYDYGFRITSRSAFVEIIIFLLVSIQSYMFYSSNFDYVARYLEAEQIGAMVREQEKRAAWKTAQLHHIRKSEEKKRLRNLQVEKMKSEMLNLQIQLNRMNSGRNFGNTSSHSDGLRRRRNSSLSFVDDGSPTKEYQNVDAELDNSFDFPVSDSLKNNLHLPETSYLEESPTSASDNFLTMEYMRSPLQSESEIVEFPAMNSSPDLTIDSISKEKIKGKEHPFISAVHLLGDGVSQVQSLGNQAVTNIVSFLNIESEESESNGHSSAEDGVHDQIESHKKFLNELYRANSVRSSSGTTAPASLQIGRIFRYIWSQMRSNNDVVCYCCFIIVFLWNFSLMSMVYLAALFLYALCVNSGPSYLFWLVMLIYTEFNILLQYLYQIIIQHCGLNVHSTILRWLGFEEHKIMASFVISTLPLFMVYVSTLLQSSITAKDGEWAPVTEFNLLNKRNHNHEEHILSYSWMDRLHQFLSPVLNVLKLIAISFSKYWRSLTQGSEAPPYFVQLSMKVSDWPEDGIQPERIETGINQLLKLAHQERCEAKNPNSCHSASRVRIQSIEKSQEDNDVALAVLEIVYASPLVGCHAAEWYRSLTPATDVASEILKAQGAGFFGKIEFPYPVISVIGGGKREVDLYAYIFGADLAVFFLVATFYQSVIKNINKFIDVYQLEDQFPKEFVFILMVLFFLIVLDRIVYLWSFATGKVIFYLFNLVLFTYSVTEYAWNMEPSHKRIGNFALRAIYLTKSVSFALQAIQIRHGIPNKSTLYRQFLTSKVAQVNYFGFRLYRALPFLYELRCVLDWSCTSTSLTMYDWLKLEDINASLFLVKCDADLNRAGHKQGQKQSRMTKFCSGICLFFILICVIWAPMLMYSSGNPTNIANPIQDVRVQIDIKAAGGRLTLFQTTLCERYSSKYSSYFEKIDPQHYLDTYNVQDIQLICCQADASSLWLVPSVVKNRYITSLRDTDMDIIITWIFTRERPKGKEAVKSESAVDREKLPTPYEVIQVLNGTTNSFRLYEAYPRYFRVTSSGEVRRLEQTVTSVSGDLYLNHDSPSWWSFHDINTSDVSGCNGMTGPMAVVVSEETPQGILGETLSKFSIWGIYITFVLAVGRFIRLQCSDLRMRIPYENLPSCDRLIAICEDIYAARAEGELGVEEVLYWTLVKIYRSPHMLLEYTKPD